VTWLLALSAVVTVLAWTGAEAEPRPCAEASSLLGLFADDPELVDDVCRMALLVSGIPSGPGPRAMKALLDTDILSEVLKSKDPHVLARARAYLAEHGRYTLSSRPAPEPPPTSFRRDRA
jgi:hypothetical protein